MERLRKNEEKLRKKADREKAKKRKGKRVMKKRVVVRQSDSEKNQSISSMLIVMTMKRSTLVSDLRARSWHMKPGSSVGDASEYITKHVLP